MYCEMQVEIYKTYTKPKLSSIYRLRSQPSMTRCNESFPSTCVIVFRQSICTNQKLLSIYRFHELGLHLPAEESEDLEFCEGKAIGKREK